MPGLFIALMCIVCVFAISPAHSREQRLVIVYTNSLNGNLDYCHCKSDPRGGLVKRATEIRKLRAAFKNMILVETGDFFTYEPDSLLCDYIVKAYKYIGYDAILPGDQEFSGGVGALVRYRNDIPFVSGNLKVFSNGKWDNPFPRTRIIGRDGIKIGIAGTISQDAFKYHPAKLLKEIKIQDQADEISKDVAKLKKDGAEFIILLSHSGYENDMELQKRLTGINVIAGGHSQTLVKEPVKSGTTLLVQAGADGSRIGILELTLRDGTVQSYKNSFLRPDEFQPADDAFVRRLINEYTEKTRKGYESLRFK